MCLMKYNLDFHTRIKQDRVSRNYTRLNFLDVAYKEPEKIYEEYV